MDSAESCTGGNDSSAGARAVVLRRCRHRVVVSGPARNGRLERDWDVSPQALTFNRLQPDATFALPVTYRLTGQTVERVTIIQKYEVIENWLETPN